jgi:hypothetical protein
MPNEAFVLKNGKKHGPFSPAQLKELALTGEIGPNDMIKRDRESLPVPARTIAGLADAFNKESQATVSPNEREAPEDWVSEVLIPEPEARPRNVEPKNAAQNAPSRSNDPAPAPKNRNQSL